MTIEDGKLNLAADGYIKNPYQAEGFHNKLSGLTNVKNDLASGVLRVDYTWGESLVAASPYYQRRNIKIPTGDVGYSFLDEKPNYINIKAAEATVANSITLRYDCVAGVEAGDNWQISTPSLFERFKTIVNNDNDLEGQTVELTADIDMDAVEMAPIGNNTYPFKGTFEGNSHTVSNLTLSGATMIAPFGNVVNGAVQNVTFKNVSATASGQRAAGAVARLQDANVLGVNVTGTSVITGSQENGGVVAVMIGESIVSNCTSAASLSGSTNSWTSNGGVVGLVYSSGELPARASIIRCTFSGSITSSYGTAYNGFIGGVLGTATESTSNTLYRVMNCTNNGTVNVPKCHYVGGVVGLARKGVEGSIVSLCHNNGNVTGTNYVGGVIGAARVNTIACSSSSSAEVNGTAASGLNRSGGAAATPGYVNGTTEKVDNSVTAVVTGSLVSVEISSKAELEAYRDAVNAGTATAGAKLTADIVLDAEEDFAPIGTADHKFEFVFDGNEHTISNLKNAGTDYVGLFGRIQGGGVKELTLMDVNLSASDGYVGGVAGSLARGALASVSVVGTVSGKTQNGGLVGRVGVVSNNDPSIIVSCSNSADVSSSSTQYTGGIVGYQDANVRLTILGCMNAGTIDGKSITGGIIAGTANTGHIILEHCINLGTVTVASGSNAFAGGIIGLAREQSSTSAVIYRCMNFADITSTSNATGGVAGLARINVSKCACLSTAVIHNNTGDASAAYGQLIVGTGGGTKSGIIVGGLGNQKTMSGCYTMDNQGAVVEEFEEAVAPAAA